MSEIYAIKAYGPDQDKLVSALYIAIAKASEFEVPITIVVPALSMPKIQF